MNRSDAKREIIERVAILADQFGDEWKNAENLRQAFVKNYPISKIRSMQLDEYVIGKGATNQSFCYRIEREMDSLGRILGATAFKFGIYFGRTKSDPKVRYRFSKIWGRNADEAFLSIKNAIADLYQSGLNEDRLAIAHNRLSPMFKGKILHIYFPEKYAPIYSTQHLRYFLAQLNISGSYKKSIDMQAALMEYRRTLPELSKQPILLYMRFLYDRFGSPKNAVLSRKEWQSLPLLVDAVNGAKFIDQIPASQSYPTTKSRPDNNRNYERQQKQNKRIGDRGEHIVFELEKKRLIQAGRPKLAKQIRHISQQSDSEGYDILSFDEDGTKRPIEVKATNASDLGRGFFMSDNELRQSKNLQNYHIYFVFSALSKKPRVLALKRPTFGEGGFDIHPISYHVIINNPKKHQIFPGG